MFLIIALMLMRGMAPLLLILGSLRILLAFRRNSLFLGVSLSRVSVSESSFSIMLLFVYGLNIIC